MPFKTILKELTEIIPGATGAILVDWEGEAVEYYCYHDDYELKLLAAHKVIILGRMKELQVTSDAGEFIDSIITTGSQFIVTGAVGSDYCLVLTLDRSAVVGQALYCFRKSVKLLEKEIY